MNKYNFNIFGPNLVQGFYLIPTLKIERHDLRSVKFGITTIFSLVFLKWEVLSFYVNIKKKVGIIK